MTTIGIYYDLCLLQISLKLDEKELEFALQDKTLMSSVLRNGLA